jgi:hypothetical protein
MEEIKMNTDKNLAEIVVRQLASHDGMCMYVYQVAHLSKKQWPRFAARPWPLVSQASDAATPRPFKSFEKVNIE